MPGLAIKPHVLQTLILIKMTHPNCGGILLKVILLFVISVTFGNIFSNSTCWCPFKSVFHILKMLLFLLYYISKNMPKYLIFSVCQKKIIRAEKLTILLGNQKLMFVF